jgi:tRNA 2-thiouridine synthesizing protein B
MSVLHIVNKSPFDRNSLDSCLRLAKADSPILLIEDGIYAVQKNTAAADKILQALANNIIDGISLVDYDGFVKLTTEHDKLQSWL